MFTFTEAYEFDWPVTVRWPGQSAEAAESFTARFRLVDEDALFARDETAGRDPLDLIRADRDRWAERLVGWSGITTEGDAPLPFSPGARDRLLRQRPIREALVRAYSDAVIYGALAEKN
ncbi:hypothetical protein [Palleronia caenipelagi]|uniref:Uncharacterized protein n=1 Tax=Palleronia caenipelagi TaxID=2489174 RepID=A0A547PW25_9RHOB|nr:hypothetical protein [Palleronia caenipelagi]TRD18347.1 hypothetical protein FEV53_11875 [Palleronia caenipelagi]